MTKPIKMKHNKRKNTGFLFEVLVSELSKAIMEGKKYTGKALVDAMKRFFGPATVLGRDLQLYKGIYDSEGIPKPVAERILRECKESRLFIDHTQLEREQAAFCYFLEEAFGPDILSSFIPNYRCLASIYQVFGVSSAAPKTQAILESALIDYMSAERGKERSVKDVEPIDGLLLSAMGKKAQEKYASFLPEQKQLMRDYAGFLDNDADSVLRLNETVKRLKGDLEAFKSDDQYLQEANAGALTYLSELATRPIVDNDVPALLKLQGIAAQVRRKE